MPSPPPSNAPPAAKDGRKEKPAKQQKSMLFGSMLSFVTKHAPQQAKIAAVRKSSAGSAYTPRKPIAEQPARQVGRGVSKKTNGSRVNDVKPDTMKERIKEHPGQHLKIMGGQLWCDACKCRVGSGKQEARKHVEQTQKHKDSVAALATADTNVGAIQAAIHDYQQEVKDAFGEAAEIKGLTRVPEETQRARAECLEEVIKARGHPSL